MSAEGSALWGQTLALVALFVAALAGLPWLIRRLQRRGLVQRGAAGGADLRVLSGVAIGPQQRVVSVEVGAGAERTVLVLGVTAQQVSCLHVLSAPSGASSIAPSSFADAMDDQRREQAAGEAAAVRKTPC